MKENFDDILKRRLEDQSFPVDDTHRAEMIRLLDNQKRRKAFPFWWFGALAVTFVAVGILWLALGDAGSPNGIQQPKDDVPSNTSDKTEIAATTEGNAIHENDATTATTIVERNNNAISNPKTIASTNSNSLSKVEKQATKSTQKPTPKSNTRLSSSKTSQTQNTTTSKSANATSTKAVTANPSGEKFYTVDEEAAKSFQILSVPVAVIVEPEMEVETAMQQEVHTSNAAQQRSNFLSPMVDPLLIGRIDYMSDHQPNVDKPKTQSHRPFYLFGEAGTGLVLASDDFTAGWTLRAGGGIGYRLNQKMQLTLGGGYFMQHGGFDFERKSTVSVLGFGARSNFNTLTPKTLHYVYARAGAQCRLNRHIIAAHGGMQYLYGAYGNIVTQTQDQFSGAESTSSDSWVKTDGLQTLLWTADVAYGYQLTPRLSLMFGTDIYFSDFTVVDPALAAEGYYWKGAYSSLHPFVTLNYLIHGHL